MHINPPSTEAYKMIVGQSAALEDYSAVASA